MRKRIGPFVLVGVIGFVVQLTSFIALTKLGGCPLLIATAASVLAAVLHNFLWHARWTWGDRRTGRQLMRLANFTFATGTSSVVGNLLFVSAFVSVCHVDPIVATVLAVGATSAFNFLVCDRYVFRPTNFPV